MYSILNSTKTKDYDMKKLFLLIGLFAFFLFSYGQCDKKVTFKCKKGRFNKNGSFEQDLPLEATLSIDNGKITFIATLNGDAENVTGEISEVSICEWTEYLQNGKTQYKAYMRRVNGDAENSIIEIEGENGSIKITCASNPDTGSKLQLDVAEYTISEDESVNTHKVETIKNERKTKKKSRSPKQ